MSQKLLYNRKLVNTQRIFAVITIAVPTIAAIFAIGLAVTGHVSWLDLALFLVFYFLTLMGITIAFHRYFAHKAFKTNRIMKNILAVLGTWCGQGPILHWVSNHRRHHTLSDKPGDPHSPNLHGNGVWNRWRGLCHAHIGSMFISEVPNSMYYAPDLIRDPDLLWINRHYVSITASGLILPAVIGGLVAFSLEGALTALLWGGFVRMMVVHHAIWSITSVAHVVGKKRFACDDESRNSYPLALLTGGEGWHNTHHTFPRSAYFSTRWFELDIGGVVLATLELLGIIWDVRRPTPRQLEERALP